MLLVAVSALVVPYLLLLTGGLSGVVRTVVNALANDGNVSVDVHGFASGIFFGTRADSVVVSDRHGLKVTVTGIAVRGSLTGYLSGSGLKLIHADSLGIRLPSPGAGAPGPPEPDMQPLFQSILQGFVTSSDTLEILRGMILEHDGTVLLDSMRIAARVTSRGTAALDVYSAGVFLPGFGGVTGSGGISLTGDRASLNGFTAVTPAGTLELSGYLLADSTLSVQGEGVFSTGFLPGAPVASGAVAMSVEGTTGSPVGRMTVSDGMVRFMERDFSFHADSLTGGMTGAGAGGVGFSTPGISGVLSGTVAFQGQVWNAAADLTLTGMDPSGWHPEAPPGNLSGTLMLRASGNGETLDSGTVQLEMGPGEIEGYGFESLRLSADADPSRVSGTLFLRIAGASLDSDWSLNLGADYQPVFWRGNAFLNISDFRALSSLLGPGAPVGSLNGVSARLSGQGTPERFRVTCTAQAGELEMGDGAASGLALSGDAAFDLSREHEARIDFTGRTTLQRFTWAGSAASGVLLDGNVRMRLPSRGEPSLAFLGSARVDSAGTGGILALGSEVVADVSLADGLPSGTVLFRSERVETPNGAMSVAFGAGSRLGLVSVDSLEILHEQGMRVAAGFSVDMTDESVSVTLDSIRVTMNKLRLVRAGGAEVNISPDGEIGIDTLWVDPPAGYLSGSGSIGSDGSIDASFTTSSVDLASLGMVFGLDFPVSGVLDSRINARGRPGDLDVLLQLRIDDPTYGSWTQGDSITVSAGLSGGLLTVDGVWIWSGGVRSGVSFAMDSVWNGPSLDLSPERLARLEAELTGIGDWLLYILPFPVMTSGASISSRIDYNRDDAYLSAGLAGHFQRLFVAGAQLEFPMSSIYVTYPDTRSEDDYNASFTITSGQGRLPALFAEVRARLSENIPLRTGEMPLEVEGYAFRAALNGWETIINGMGWVSLSGNLSASSSDMTRRPVLRGKITLDQGVIALRSEQGADAGGGESQEAQLPFDLYVKVQAERGLWLRSSYMNIELAADITVLTQEGRPAFTGNISVVRGTLSVLNKDFRITHGTVEIIQGTPPGFMINITAEARVRSSMSREVYTIEVTVTGDPENPEIALSGSGAAGDLTNEDIITLLTLGVTYGEMQQMDSGAIENELESVTQGMLGNMIARSIREGIGLDALSISPDLLADSTGLTVEVGKYVLPNLYVGYIDDVFSPKPGTISAQYFFSRDIYLEGSTKTTLTGNQEPTLELHYTIRY